MQTTATFDFLRYVTLLRLTGPIFDKESRVASRRRSSYALQAGYVALLTVYIVSIWCTFLGVQKANPAFAASRLGGLASHITMRVIGFQFAAAQLIAAAILSSSVGSEMRTGTLSVLMTTPITSFHIMVGKLLGGLLQVALLLAISLPVLAILRVFGGVPWGPVFACFCITVTAVALAGTLSLLLSTYYYHPFDAVSAGAIAYLFFLVGLPAAATVLAGAGILNQPATLSVLDLASPFRALVLSLPASWQSPPKGPGYFFWWPAHCLFVVGLAGALSCAAAWRIRRAVPVRFLSGSPSVGRENPVGWWRRRRGSILIVAAALVVCTLTMLAEAAGRSIAPDVFYVAWGLWMVALLRLTVSVVGSITRAKESGAWPVLLTTPLDDEKILRSRAMASLRRNAVLLICALAIQMCFFLCASSSPKAMSVGLCLLSAVASVFFITAAGLYFGVRLKTTTSAVVATFSTYLCLNYIVCGRFNPLFGWLLWSLLASGGARGAHLMLLGFGVGAATFVLDTALGMFLARRALKIMRCHIF